MRRGTHWQPEGGIMEQERGFHSLTQEWKLLSFSQSQELSQRPYLAPDWLYKSEKPIRSQVSLLTKLLTLTKTQKFPSQVGDRLVAAGGLGLRGPLATVEVYTPYQGA